MKKNSLSLILHKKLLHYVSKVQKNSKFTQAFIYNGPGRFTYTKFSAEIRLITWF